MDYLATPLKSATLTFDAPPLAEFGVGARSFGGDTQAGPLYRADVAPPCDRRGSGRDREQPVLKSCSNIYIYLLYKFCWSVCLES